MSDEQQDKKLAIKFLITKSNAGSLIGTGGKAIKELIEITEARVNVSGVNDLYPGSNDRVVYITGSMETVSATQHLIHEMLGLTAVSAEKDFEWNPALAAENPGQNDDAEITSKISIPASAGGLILGKQGNTLRSIMETSEAKVVMTTKDDALFTQERILTISGTVKQCIDCVDLVLNKMAEEEDIPQFVNRGTTYRSGPFNGRTGLGKGPNRAGPEAERLSDGVSTTITIQIPNDLIGNIFGKQGSTMREIISLSGANVVVSPRDEEGKGSMRIVTITGTPEKAQNAHHYITQRLQTPSNRPPRKPRN